MDKDAKDQFLAGLAKLYRFVGEENQVVFVAYPSGPVCSREVTAMAVTEAAVFGNDGGDISKNAKMYAHTFVSDGSPTLGNDAAVQQRLGRELYMMNYNMERAMGFVVSRNPVRYINGDGKCVVVEPPPFEPELDVSYVDRMRGLYATLEQNSRAYAITMSKTEFRSAQDKALVLLKRHQNSLSVAELSDTSASQMPLIGVGYAFRDNKRKRPDEDGDQVEMDLVLDSDEDKDDDRYDCDSDGDDGDGAESEDDDKDVDVSFIVEHCVLEVWLCRCLCTVAAHLSSCQDGRKRFLVRYKGYGERDDEWLDQKYIKYVDLLC